MPRVASAASVERGSGGLSLQMYCSCGGDLYRNWLAASSTSVCQSAAAAAKPRQTELCIELCASINDSFYIFISAVGALARLD